MKKITLGLLVLSANIILALVGRGSMDQWIIIIVLIEFIALPAILIGLIAFSFRHKWKLGSALTNVCVSIVVVIISTVVSLVPGRILLKNDIAAAKHYCEALVPKLEAFRIAHGEYPSSIGELSNPESPPRLLNDSEFYQSERAEYSFSFGDPSGMLSGFAFDSKTKTWSTWD